MINPQKAVEWYKQRFNTEGLSDYDIYESVKQLHPDLDYMDNPFGVKQELQIPTLEEAEENTNPSFFEKLTIFFSPKSWAILTVIKFRDFSIPVLKVDKP